MFRRPMAFAGAWYPAAREVCERQILEYWREPVPKELAGTRLGVVPHAGWTYSGRLAARVFQALADPSQVDLVIILGGHLGEADPLVVMVEGAWQTPFGDFTLHTDFRSVLEALPLVVFETEGRCHADNSTEVQLPFAKYKYPAAELLVLRVPPSGVALELGRALGDYLSHTGLRAVTVASTDLTHYGPNYAFEPHGRGPQALQWVKRENDARFIRAVSDGSGGQILAVARQYHNACSPGSVAALSEVALKQGRRFEALTYTTSQDVLPGDARNFVGYLAGVYV